MPEKLWPESKVLDLMRVAFFRGAIMSQKYGESINIVSLLLPEMWEIYRKNTIEQRLKYVNPDRRCHHPVDLDAFNYCWGYAMEVDKKVDKEVDKEEEINMEKLCKKCEFFKEEHGVGGMQ